MRKQISDSNAGARLPGRSSEVERDDPDRALERDPKDRFQSAEEFRAALTAAISNVATEHTGAYAAAHLSGATPALAHPSGATPSATVRLNDATPAAASGRPAPPAPSAAPNAGPVPRPAASAPTNPATEGATIVLQRNHFAVAGVLLGVVAIGVAALAYVALRQPAPSAPQTADTAQTAPDTSAASSAATPPSAAPLPAPTAAVPVPAPAPSPKAAVQPPATKAAPKPKPAPPVEVKKEPEWPPFVFDANAVVAEGGKHREHDAKALLSGGEVTVTEKNDRVIATIPFGAIVGISYSNSKQPRWNSPTGPADLFKVEGGAFGFLKGGRNWLAVRTKDTSLVLRVGDESLRRVVAALEERTGQKVDCVVDQKD